MRIKSQDEILDIAIRKKIIEEISGSENVARKQEHYKRQMAFKDKTDHFVVEQLSKQFDMTTVQEMSFAIPNISIVKKVINKLATVYNNGVKRFATDENGIQLDDQTKSIEELSEYLDLDQKQKLTNKLLKLHKNVDVYVKPCPTSEGKWQAIVQPLAPYLYDVIESYYDRTKPLVYVLSYFKYGAGSYISQDASKEGRGISSVAKPSLGDGQDQLIADSPSDDNADKKEFIWWSDKYHFTTNEKAEIISETNENPIEIKPFVTYAIDQENSFWSEGGDDLVDQAISINTQIAHQNYIGVLQGYGQAYFKGKNVPRNIVVGPNKVIMMEYDSEDPVPDFGFASANPPLASLQAAVEMQLALLLTTNNLSTKSISTTMTAGGDFPSAIAMVIDQAESTEDANEQRNIFYKGDELTLKIANKWNQFFASNSELSDEAKETLFSDDVDIVIHFGDQRSILSEKERLENIEKRKSLGLNTQEELMMMDQPGLSEEQASQKIELIAKQKQEKLKMFSKQTEVVDNEDSQDDNNLQDDVQ